MPDCTEFVALVSSALSSETSTEGDAVKLKVDEPVIVAGDTPIRAGAVVRGTLTEVQDARHMGRAGKFNLRIETVTLAEAQRAKPRSAKAKGGDEWTGQTIALTVLFGRRGLLRRGNDAEIKAGTPLHLFTDELMTLTSIPPVLQRLSARSPPPGVRDPHGRFRLKLIGGPLAGRAARLRDGQTRLWVIADGTGALNVRGRSPWNRRTCRPGIRCVEHTASIIAPRRRSGSRREHFRGFADAERYRFDVVTTRFETPGWLGAFHLMTLACWNAERARMYVARRLVSGGAEPVDAGARALAGAIAAASTDADRFRIVLEEWGFGLPMGCAILTVCSPASFTVYGTRVSDQLGKFRTLGNRPGEARSTGDPACVHAARDAVPAGGSPRECDHWLWGRSRYESLTTFLGSPAYTAKAPRSS